MSLLKLEGRAEYSRGDVCNNTLQHMAYSSLIGVDKTLKYGMAGGSIIYQVRKDGKSILEVIFVTTPCII